MTDKPQVFDADLGHIVADGCRGGSKVCYTSHAAKSRRLGNLLIQLPRVTIELCALKRQSWQLAAVGMAGLFAAVINALRGTS